MRGIQRQNEKEIIIEGQSDYDYIKSYLLRGSKSQAERVKFNMKLELGNPGWS